MTRDNLKKRHIKKPEGCAYCSEKESIHHLFFECVVSQALWNTVAQYFDKPLGQSYESIASFCIANKNHSTIVGVNLVGWYFIKFYLV